MELVVQVKDAKLPLAPTASPKRSEASGILGPNKNQEGIEDRPATYREHLKRIADRQARSSYAVEISFVDFLGSIAGRARTTRQGATIDEPESPYVASERGDEGSRSWATPSTVRVSWREHLRFDAVDCTPETQFFLRILVLRFEDSVQQQRSGPSASPIKEPEVTQVAEKIVVPLRPFFAIAFQHTRPMSSTTLRSRRRQMVVPFNSLESPQFSPLTETRSTIISGGSRGGFREDISSQSQSGSRRKRKGGSGLSWTNAETENSSSQEVTEQQHQNPVASNTHLRVELHLENIVPAEYDVLNGVAQSPRSPRRHEVNRARNIAELARNVVVDDNDDKSVERSKRATALLKVTDAALRNLAVEDLHAVHELIDELIAYQRLRHNSLTLSIASQVDDVERLTATAAKLNKDLAHLREVGHTKAFALDTGVEKWFDAAREKWGWTKVGRRPKLVSVLAPQDLTPEGGPQVL